jgi:hypothetical protein
VLDHLVAYFEKFDEINAPELNEVDDSELEPDVEDYDEFDASSGVDTYPTYQLWGTDLTLYCDTHTSSQKRVFGHKLLLLHANPETIAMEELKTIIKALVDEPIEVAMFDKTFFIPKACSEVAAELKKLHAREALSHIMEGVVAKFAEPDSKETAYANIRYPAGPDKMLGAHAFIMKARIAATHQSNFIGVLQGGPAPEYLIVNGEEFLPSEKAMQSFLKLIYTGKEDELSEEADKADVTTLKKLAGIIASEETVVPETESETDGPPLTDEL